MATGGAGRKTVDTRVSTVLANCADFESLAPVRTRLSICAQEQRGVLHNLGVQAGQTCVRAAQVPVSLWASPPRFVGPLLPVYTGSPEGALGSAWDVTARGSVALQSPSLSR